MEVRGGPEEEEAATFRAAAAAPWTEQHSRAVPSAGRRTPSYSHGVSLIACCTQLPVCDLQEYQLQLHIKCHPFCKAEIRVMLFICCRMGRDAPYFGPQLLHSFCYLPPQYSMHAMLRRNCTWACVLVLHVHLGMYARTARGCGDT